jgi:hypothetical protein
VQQQATVAQKAAQSVFSPRAVATGVLGLGREMSRLGAHIVSGTKRAVQPKAPLRNLSAASVASGSGEASDSALQNLNSSALETELRLDDAKPERKNEGKCASKSWNTGPNELEEPVRAARCERERSEIDSMEVVRNTHASKSGRDVPELALEQVRASGGVQGHDRQGSTWEEHEAGCAVGQGSAGDVSNRGLLSVRAGEVMAELWPTRLQDRLKACSLRSNSRVSG